jgi:DNA primase
MAFIPEDKLLEIKDAARIEEVVGQYVQLTQKGKNLLGLCPFHADTTPSFTVSPDKGIFKCFGCGAGGNVFHFLMQHQRLSFPEAVQELARRYGIPLTFRELGPEGSQQAKKRALAYEINAQAAAFYQATLAGSQGQAGRDYLKKRGLTPEVIQAFHLGYAPDEWDSLRRHLQTRGLSLELAQEVGLLVAKERGGFYDRFRHRTIFPILDRQSRVIAFGGRSIGPGEPKYLNSPESLLYFKGRNLYGLPQAQEAMRRTETAIVVEGYLDLIALAVHGIANVVATLGTALTREQVRLLKNLAPRVVLVFDGDAAGAKAMKRAFPLFAQEALPVRALALPAGMDPDSYAHTHGVELFQGVWDAAQPWFVYLLEDLISAHGLEVEGRVRIIEELRPYLQVLADPVEQDLWLKLAAQRLAVEEAVLKRSLASFAPIAPSRLAPKAGLAVSRERELLRWVLWHAEAVVPEELEEWAGEFEDQELKELLDLVIRNYREHGRLDHSLLVQQVAAENLRQQICALTLGEEEASDTSLDRLAASWRRDLQVRRLKKVQRAIKEKMAAVAVQDSGEDILAMLDQAREIDRQLENLKIGSTAKGENG